MIEASVFNSSLEAGVRTLSFLDIYYPQTLDFEQLMKIDYVLVNSKDFGGPESLHPLTPNRQGELSSRREAVRSGIELMKRFGLIELELTKNGAYYRASEEAEPYLDLMRKRYSLAIREIASWLAEEIHAFGFKRINVNLDKKVF
jgi:hypothetical protein